MADDDVQRLFEAVRRKTSAERAAFLEGLEAVDLELRAKLELLLSGGDTVGQTTALRAPPPNAADFERVGPYRIVRKIGEGGMGSSTKRNKNNPFAARSR